VPCLFLRFVVERAGRILFVVVALNAVLACVGADALPSDATPADAGTGGLEAGGGVAQGAEGASVSRT